MSVESARKYWEACKTDDNLRSALMGVGPDEFDAKVKALGYDFDLDEMMQVMAEINK